MPDIPLAQIFERNINYNRYRLNYNMAAGIQLISMFDFEQNRQFVELGLTDKPFPVARIYWDGQDGFAHLIKSNSWTRLQGRPFLDELKRLGELLRGEREVRVEEDGVYWILDYRLQNLPLYQQLPTAFRSLFQEPLSNHLEHLIEFLIDNVNSIEIILQLKVNRDNLLIRHLNIKTSLAGQQRETHVDILPLQEEVPEPPIQIRRLSLPVISPGMVLFNLNSIGGWSSRETHGPWTQRVIDLIKQSEENIPKMDRLYTEIYDPGWSTHSYTEVEGRAKDPEVHPEIGKHHPLIVGAVNEDSTESLKSKYDLLFAEDDNFQSNNSFYYSANKYKRYYHHFGGEGTGLEYKLYFLFEGPPKTTQGNRYYSARDWGYGYGRLNDESLNRLTFTRAIEQYHRYSEHGKSLAYLMLGHVLHLLEDVGEPDHAALVDHAGSGMNQFEAYQEYKYCYFLALESAVFFGCAIDIVALACLASASKKIMGYEKLIGLGWDISRVNTTIQNTGIIRKSNYDNYFRDLAQFGLNKVSQLGLGYALGCSTLKIIPPIPNADPSIDSDNESEKQPYYDLTDAIVPEIIGMNAGLLTHFYDIVNYPPFLERLMIVQFEPNARPIRFGVLREDAPNHCTRYDAGWISSGVSGRTIFEHKNQPLALDYPAYIFLLFGPSNIFPKRSKRMKRNLKLRMKGVVPGSGENIDEFVQLEEAEDNSIGPYYWGSFKVSNCANDPYTVFFEVSGQDFAPHNTNRTPSGSELDADPTTMPTVDFTQPSFPWNNYLPGIDQHHKIQVPTPVWEIEASPPGHFTMTRSSRETIHEITLRIKQKSWDCNWELCEGVPTCSLEWELDPNIGWLNPRSGNFELEPWRNFNLSIELFQEARSHTATIRVSANPETRHGMFRLTILYKYGYFSGDVLLTFDIF